MHFRAIVGLVGVVSASCLWAAQGRFWELLPAPRSNGALSPSQRLVFRESERIRRAESSSWTPHHPGVAASQVQRLNANAASSPDQFTHATVPLRAPTNPQIPCSHVQVMSTDDSRYQAAHRMHEQATDIFIGRSGFGLSRVIQDFRGRPMPLPSESVERVELVSLLVHPDPAVYVVKYSSPMNREPPVERRPLDPYEELALDHLRQGADLVESPDHPWRLFGAIRARADCLNCHTSARENELLGAFSYTISQ